jgi:DNA-binding response OmpR family regulator
VESLKVLIYRLRQKVEPDPANPRYLLTERGVGYCLGRVG